MLDWLGRQRQRLQARQPGEAASAAALPPPEAAIASDEQRSANLRVLVVDDDLFVGRLIIEALGPYYEIEVACDATEADHAIEKRQPDLITLDIMMPGQDGQEIGNQLRRHARTRQIPFIIVSGDHRIAEKAAAAGAAAYLAKPFDIDELTALVARVLAERQPPPE